MVLVNILGAKMETLIKEKNIKISNYPTNVIPKNVIAFIGVDEGSGDYTTEVKGFFDPITKEFHIQEYNKLVLPI